MKTTRPILAFVSILALAASGLSAQTPDPSPSPAPPNYIAQVRGSDNPDQRAADTIVATVTQAAAMDYQAIQRAATLLWKDPTRAQIIVDRMGERAAPVFVVYGALSGPLAYLDPASYARLPRVPPGYSWTILPPGPEGHWPVGQRSVVISYTPPTP